MTSYPEFLNALEGLVQKFSKLYPEIRTNGLDEANLRIGFLDPLFEALGWDIRNTTHASLYAREVVVEPPNSSNRKRPDYLFRIGSIDKFICEAKRPRDYIDKHFFQVQNYVYNSRLWVGILSDFEFLIAFVVGAQPKIERPFDPAPGWRLHYTDFVAKADAIWKLLSHEAVAEGSLEHFAQSLPKASGRGRQGWLLKPDRTRTVDNDFLGYLEEQRRRLAKSIYERNRGPSTRSRAWTGSELTEATQRIIDRILFQRICEDRDIDVHHTLKRSLDDWSSHGALRDQLWPTLVGNFQFMRRAFNGGIYGRHHDQRHFIDDLEIEDEWLDDFISTLTGDDTQYLLNIIPVEILGSVYERFLGKVIVSKGTVVPKPEVKKSGGVFYTPQYISDYIVGCTLGQRLSQLDPTQVARLRILDPACGSGSFLLRAFERLCQWHIEWLMAHPDEQKSENCYIDRIGNLRLTTGFKRKILTENIFGVDRDPQAVEVTQMSLYLKVLEGESQQTLERDHRLFPRETYLPDLSQNIKCGNSLIGPDAVKQFDDGELETVKPFSWEAEFPKVMKGGRFDFVIGNPPYVSIQVMTEWAPKEVAYLKTHFEAAREGNIDLYLAFIEKGFELLNKNGELGFIVPNKLFKTDYGGPIRRMLTSRSAVREVVDFAHEQVFDTATTYTCLLFIGKSPVTRASYRRAHPGPHILRSPAREVTLEKGGAPWSFSGADAAALVAKLHEGAVPLSELGCVMSRGSSSGADDVFTVRRSGDKYLTRDGSQEELEEAILRRPIHATDFTRYNFKGVSDERIIFPYVRTEGGYELISEGALRREFPRTHAYLKRYKRDLTARKQYTNWYSFSAPRSLALHDQADFLVPLLANKGLYAPYPRKGKYCLMASGGFSIGCHGLPKGYQKSFLLGLLNSKLLYWYLQSISNIFRGGWITCTKQYVFRLPIKLLNFEDKRDRASHDEISRAAERLIAQCELLGKAQSEIDIATASRSVRVLEDEVDAAVYKLYCIDASEQACIEAELNSQGQTSS